ncbi:uncharacterized protein LOC130740368 [Lotus japonicus]|uniref:uncharacterized protein LOC130740368 n=1 Tax=Lotus japonicus TaxID=34305 RepID=UPI00258ACC0F|nr:uncharacterized protein LOC130740368 [Lotus japonicus]
MERSEKVDSADGRVFPKLVVGLATGQSGPILRSRSNESTQAEIKSQRKSFRLLREVLCELRVDFKNIAENGLDLRPAVKLQGCEGYFNRLTGPIYDKLVKEFWKHAECDDLQVVSYVLGKKIIITERSIALLLGPDTITGYRFQANDSKLRAVKDTINSVLYENWKPGKSDYKTRELHPDLRIWHKIMLNCFNPRPIGSSPDYINFNQKVMLYFIKTGQKICLPYFLFNYLKDCIRRSRTTDVVTKNTIKYIPFGRLLSDLFVESNLVKDLIAAGCTKDLSTLTGDAFTSTTMKRMCLIEKKIEADSFITPEEIKGRRIPLNDYPLWSKADDPEPILYYIEDLRSLGFEIDVDEFFRALPEAPDYESPKKKKTKRKKKDTTTVAKDDSKDALPSPPTQQTSVIQPTTTITTTYSPPPKTSLIQPSIEDEPLWQRIQNPQPSEQTSTILLPYPSQASEPQQGSDQQALEKQDSEPQPSDHSEQETPSPTGSIPFVTNTVDSSPSNNSESQRKFFQAVSDRISELPENILSAPSPNRYP